MRAIGYRAPLSIDLPGALEDITLPEPVPFGRDLLVEVKAIAVNPVDVKIRASTAPKDADWKVLGWDAAGIVRAVGPDVRHYKPGDEVFYAGAIDRPGANSQLHCVDERIVGRKPQTLDWAQAAALPLTSLTAWELLFERMDVSRPVPGGAPAVLIIGGAGGVGSIAIQLLRILTDLTVIATASRTESIEWVKGLGAHHVIDHRQPLAQQIEALGIGAPSFVFSTTHSDDYISEVTKLIAPQGRFGLIDEHRPLDVVDFQLKAVSVHWELMFTRSLFQTPDMERQKEILDEVSSLCDSGKINTTMTDCLTPIHAENLIKAHKRIESGRTIGKLALSGFPE